MKKFAALVVAFAFTVAAIGCDNGTDKNKQPNKGGSAPTTANSAK